MVVTSGSRAQALLTIGAVLAVLYAAVFAIVGSAMSTRAPEPIALAATLDLTVTATAVVWWFGVRRRAVSPWIAVAVLSWGVSVARRWVPHAPLGALFAAAGTLEVVALGWLAVRIRRVIRGARAVRTEGPIGALEAGLVAARLPPRVAAIVAAELTVISLVLTGWFRRPPPGALAMRSTGWMLVAGLIGFLLGVESVAFHILLAMWSPVVAWLATASSGYAMLWLIADAQAIRLYPVAVIDGVLRVTIGVRWRAAIPLAAIASIDRVSAVPAGALSLALLEPTVLVTLHAPVVLRGLLGRTRSADRIALTIDDPDALIAAVAAILRRE